MNGFAYLDKYGILHAVASKETALKSSKNGKVVSTDLCDGSGYMDENGMSVFINASEKTFSHGKNKNKDEKLSETEFARKYPKTYAVYRKLI
ncbi:MAG: hypothetical protein HFE90_09305 [Firmicutes bacterium]|nr:hypothetical protein [Bacillota bacterium]